MRPPLDDRSRYPHVMPVQTRWMDNDAYGHVNNVVYYSYFDTVINAWLVAQGGLDIAGGPVIGLCVESHCRYARPVAFPEALEAGLRVEHLGRTSARYGIGIFLAGQSEAAAEGWFVHVFVDRATRAPAPIPDAIRAALARLA